MLTHVDFKLCSDTICHILQQRTSFRYLKFQQEITLNLGTNFLSNLMFYLHTLSAEYHAFQDYKNF